MASPFHAAVISEVRPTARAKRKIVTVAARGPPAERGIQQATRRRVWQGVRMDGDSVARREAHQSVEVDSREAEITGGPHAPQAREVAVAAAAGGEAVIGARRVGRERRIGEAV